MVLVLVYYYIAHTYAYVYIKFTDGITGQFRNCEKGICYAQSVIDCCVMSLCTGVSSTRRFNK